MTGIANHLAQGWIRTILENSHQLNKDQAENLMDRIIKQLYYRDCRAFARVSCSHFNRIVILFVCC
jgi:hypothetical protein